MNDSNSFRLLSLLFFIVPIGCMNNSPADPGSSTSQQVVGVSGNKMTLNGAPWVLRGVMIRGFVGTPAFLQANVPDTYPASQNYGQTELTAAQAFGADELRFQVSMPSLDPLNPLYSAAYVTSVVNAIKLARQNGFVVDISMQDEYRSGDPVHHPLPTAETVADWDMLTSFFGSDRGIIFELYNEPNLSNTTANWQLWLNGDPTNTSSVAHGAVGMQTLLNRLRSEGSTNVMIVDGLGGAANSLDGALPLSDPMGLVVYAVHPYLFGSADESKWDANFGIPSLTLPVICDEWSAQAGNPLGLGQLPTYQPAVDLLNYLRSHSIPVGVGEFDVSGFMVQNEPGWTPTNYDDYQPVSTPDLKDAGSLVHILFMTNYSRPLTLADGL